MIGTNNIKGSEPYSKKIKVNAIIIHPDFNMESYDNDIALFHLKKAVRYNNYIQPICLPFGVFQRLNKNTTCFISGWGRTKEVSISALEDKFLSPTRKKKNIEN